MKQVIENYNGEFNLEDVPAPVLKSGGILVYNRFSLISAGTERATIEISKKNILSKAKERPEELHKVINAVKKHGLITTYKTVKDRLDSPLPMGYSCAGIIKDIAPDISEFHLGDKVACAGLGYASHAEIVFIPKNLCVKVPENVSLEEASFVTVGAIALQGVRQSQAQLGENIAVIGLGLVGLLTVQILKAMSCNVLGIDIDPEKIKIAGELGADLLAQRGKDDIENIALDFTKGHGFDAVIITAATSSNDPIELAGKISRDKGKVIVVGNVSMEVPRKTFYEKELDIRLSRSYGPGRYDPLYEEKGIDYPIGYVRWTENRNMQAFLNLISTGNLYVKKLITHKFSINDAEKAYDVILGKTNESYIGVLLEYNSEFNSNSRVILPAPKSIKKNFIPANNIKLGFIGAGKHARTFLLPNIKDNKSITLTGVATASGINAKHIAKKFGFRFCTTDYNEILNDPEITAVVIATRHNLHARVAIEAMKKNKVVFMEKPLAINRIELDEIISSWKDNNGRIMVGFNRRFSPFTQKIKEFFYKRSQPIVINYRINAGSIQKDHWIQDSIEGGGRIIGEVCHFVDFLQFVIGSYPICIYAESISANSQTVIDNDNISITIKFEDGSLGNILYLANGDTSFSKERIEIFGNNSVAILDDFKKLQLVKDGKTTTKSKFTQDKGFKNELLIFLDSIKNAKEMPIPFKDSVVATLITFMIEESLMKNIPLNFDHRVFDF